MAGNEKDRTVKQSIHYSLSNISSRSKWVITKTSQKLGWNQYREGTWDCLEGLDKHKCQIPTIVAVCAARYIAINYYHSDAAFLLALV